MKAHRKKSSARTSVDPADVYERAIETKRARYAALRSATAGLLYTKQRICADVATAELREIEAEVVEAKRALLRCKAELSDLERERIRVIATLNGVTARRAAARDDDGEALSRVREHAEQVAFELAAEQELFR